jgi:hypothetical protein
MGMEKTGNYRKIVFKTVSIDQRSINKQFIKMHQLKKKKKKIMNMSLCT